MIKRSILSILILVVLFGLLVVEGVEAKTKVTIWSAFPEIHEYIVAVANQYMKENPNIEIEATLYPQRAQEEKVAVALPTGQAADLIELDKMMLYPYYVDGYLEPLTGDMETWLKEKFPADGVEAVRAEDGNIYCFPWFVSLKVMFYNKTYFEEAGITKTPDTIDEMMEMAQKLVKRDANNQVTRAGIDLRLSGGGFGTAQKFWCQSMIPYGAKVIEKVGDKWRAGYDNEAGLKAIQMYLNAVYRDNVESFDVKSDAEGFGLGLSAMFQRESWVVGYMTQNAPDVKYGAFLMPKGPGGDWGTVGNTMALGVNKASKNKKEALDFAMYMMNDDNSRKMIDETGWQPFRAHVDYSDIIKKHPVLQTFVDGLSTEGHRVYDYENIPPISEIHNRFAERLMRSFKMKELYDDPDQLKKFIHEMAEETNEILAEYDLLAEE
ncbi:extracellular solute-binding protein [Candidatus Vecturithrix granuli]|uniref:Extracellular solute-binding protein n=1 Tax=Vecturithrix granuli TaxID=1499967 RepID=A0A081C8U1_VECG1|nr:extracellular solute-binding protein [Candidatus Vecturithrix granuli]